MWGVFIPKCYLFTSVSMSAWCVCPAGNREASLEAGNMQKQQTGSWCLLSVTIFVTVDQNASNIVKSLIFYFHPSIFVIKKKKQFLHPMFLLRSKSYMLKVPTSSKTQFILSLLTSMEQLTHLFLQLPFHLQLYFYLYLSGIN